VLCRFTTLRFSLAAITGLRNPAVRNGTSVVRSCSRRRGNLSGSRFPRVTLLLAIVGAPSGADALVASVPAVRARARARTRHARVRLIRLYASPSVAEPRRASREKYIFFFSLLSFLSFLSFPFPRSFVLRARTSRPIQVFTRYLDGISLPLPLTLFHVVVTCTYNNSTGMTDGSYRVVVSLVRDRCAAGRPAERMYTCFYVHVLIFGHTPYMRAAG